MDVIKFIQDISKKFYFDSNYVCCAHVRFDVSQYDKKYFSECNIEFPISLSAAVIKRQAEYFAGRYAAHNTLKRLTHDSHQVAIGADRAPVWPSGIIGSITHTASEAVAVTAYTANHRFIGVDLEVLLTPDLAEKLAYQIINEQERIEIKESGLSFYKGLTLMFSAKESLYKALYPQVKKIFDFKDVFIHSIDVDRGQFQATLVGDLAEDLPVGWQVKGHYKCFGYAVLTLIMDDVSS